MPFQVQLNTARSLARPSYFSYSVPFHEFSSWFEVNQAFIPGVERYLSSKEINSLKEKSFLQNSSVLCIQLHEYAESKTSIYPGNSIGSDSASQNNGFNLLICGIASNQKSNSTQNARSQRKPSI